MPTVEFEFKTKNAWTMGPACGDAKTPSINPAPATTSGIYIIHNDNENTTYVGYADNAVDRWQTRTEVFHCFGIPASYGSNILCAWCVPTMKTGSIFLKGLHAAEHLLIRAVCKGLLGPTTNTNTQLSNIWFTNSSVTKIRVYLPKDPWGTLLGAREVSVSNPF